ncbi:MAG TPA: MASE1 domain-containing protein, partial [Pyrinomonadaceae bacterium]|nr:MASE1 domain-containing protein [Pyrinomonadaceae bacterium]
MSKLVVGTEEPRRANLMPRYGHIIRPVLATLLVSLAYYIGAKIGFALTFSPHPVSTLWPPNAILFAALLLTPVRWWWFLLLAVFPAHFLVQDNAEIPRQMMLCWYISNCTEGLIGASVFRYLVKEAKLDTTYHVGIFLFVAIL